MVDEAGIEAVVVAAPTTAHSPLALAAIERGLPGAGREAARGHGGGGDRARRGRPGPRGSAPGRPRRTLQPGRPRARPAHRQGLGGDAVLDHQPTRRSVPGPDPRCRGDHRPRHPRRRHPLVGGRRAADAGLRGDGPAAARHERGSSVRAAPLSLRRDRHARRQLADPGQAAPAHGGRGGGHVRARLPDPAADVHERRRRQPHDHRRLRDHVRGRTSSVSTS